MKQRRGGPDPRARTSPKGRGGARSRAPRSGPALRVRRLRADARLPGYMSSAAAGLDLAAALDAPLELGPGARALVTTGLAIEIAEGYEGQVRPRSGLALRHGVTVLNAPGTIDADYRGEVCVLLVNHGGEPYRVQPGDRIAQLVVARVERAAVVEVEKLTPTTRGTGGFGHTGSGTDPLAHPAEARR